MKHILLFCYHSLLYSCGHDKWTVTDICNNIDITQPIDKEAMRKVSDFLSIVEFLRNDVLQKYLELIRMSLLPQSSIAHIYINVYYVYFMITCNLHVCLKIFHSILQDEEFAKIVSLLKLNVHCTCTYVYFPHSIVHVHIKQTFRFLKG